MIALVSGWGGDLSVGPTGDIGAAPIQIEVKNRIVRRLLTNPGDYIWHSDYGAGLGTYVGQPFTLGVIKGTILRQLQHETLVEINPPPTIQANQSIAGSVSAISVTVQYQIIGLSIGGSVTLGANT